jgi:hypothetical protein
MDLKPDRLGRSHSRKGGQLSAYRHKRSFDYFRSVFFDMNVCLSSPLLVGLFPLLVPHLLVLLVPLLLLAIQLGL